MRHKYNTKSVCNLLVLESLTQPGQKPVDIRSRMPGDKPVEYLPGVPDYSSVHRPVGDLFSAVQDKSEWEPLKLSQQQVDQFWRDGFLLNVPVLSPEQCDRILDDYKYFLGGEKHPGHEMLFEYHSNQTSDPDNVLMHCLGHWRLTKHFHDLAFLPDVVVKTSQLLEPSGKMTSVRFWHDQLFAKPPKHGGGVAWHQDYSYWTRTTPMKHLTIHIALDEQTEDNGAIQYVPGSHRWTRNGGAPLPVTDFNFKDMDSIQTILTEEEKSQWKPVCSTLKKGEASFHHALSVHGSYGNRSDRPRRAAVLNYFADGVCSNSNEPLLKDIIIPKGEKMGGQFFPLVFDPAWME